MDYISIKNWEKYQHYHDRNPPWIKLYHSLLDDYEYCCLQDASKLLLISLFLLASRTDNKIPADPDWIKSKAAIKGKLDFKPLVTIGFIKVNGDGKQDASKMLASDKQNGVPETEERQRRDRGEKSIYTEDFKIFWKAYPKKEKKGGAVKAWNKLKNPQKILGLILPALEWQKETKDWKKEKGRFIPQPTSYLNGLRWEDEPIPIDPLEGKVSEVTRQNIESFKKWRTPDERQKEIHDDDGRPW